MKTTFDIVLDERALASSGPAGLVGAKHDFHFHVPLDDPRFVVLDVFLRSRDKSSSLVSIGEGSGKATLHYDQGGASGYVHAWVNGAVGRNRIEWEVVATCMLAE